MSYAIKESLHPMRSQAIERIHRALEDIAAGKMVVLVDDEQRENEGDLVMAADMVTPEAINFMARYGRGLICLTLGLERLALGLQGVAFGLEHRGIVGRAGGV
jgi:3,4-dihydroxy-2-butanone 4-phosphate synthase